MTGWILPTASAGDGRLGRRGVAATRPLLLRVALALGAVAVWLWLAADGRLHWDEPDYLYMGAYLSVPEILAGDYQPSGIEGFSVSRVGHVLLLKLVVSLLGPGAASLAVIVTCYLVMLAGLLWITYLILRALMPGVPNPGAAVALCAFTPIYVYLAFKTVAEIPAALLASLAVLAFLRSFRSRPRLWLTVVALALAGTALTKNHVALLHVAFVAALLLAPGLRYRPGRVAAHAFLSGAGSVVIFLAVLWATGLPLDLYFAPAVAATSLFEGEPFEARLLALALEGGPFFLALPLAVLSPRRAEARFFAVWFALATLPLLLSPRLEERYLVTNFVAIAGLVQLSIEGLRPLVRRWWAARPWAVAAAAGIGGVALIGSAALAQQLAAHGVRTDQLRTVLNRIDATYGRGNYAILTPQEGGIFLYLRFVEPEAPVYTVFTPRPPNHRDAVAWAAFQQRYYGPRALRTIEDLTALGLASLVYVSFDESLPVANLRRLAASALPPALRRVLDRRLAKMSLLDQLGQSWMWNHPQIAFEELFRHGHYVALRAELVPAADSGGSDAAEEGAGQVGKR